MAELLPFVTTGGEDIELVPDSYWAHWYCATCNEFTTTNKRGEVGLHLAIHDMIKAWHGRSPQP